jgi:hypothetical protein
METTVNILLQKIMAVGWVPQVIEDCKHLAERFRKMFWPEVFWWTMQKRGVYARDYHNVRFDAMDCEFKIFVLRFIILKAG